MRLDLAAIVIFSISGLVMAGLHANQHFFLPALAPMLYNLGQIFGVTILSPAAGPPPRANPAPRVWDGIVRDSVWGDLGRHVASADPGSGLIRYEFHWKPVLEWKSAGVQRVLILLGPRVLTMACIQAYFVARDNLASRFNAVGVGALNLGWTIEQVPETIIGTAIAVALLPSLAGFINRGQTGDFTRTVNRALRVMLAFCLPAAVLLALIVRPLAQSFFGFDPARLDLLTACTWAFLVGLLGDTWLEIAVRSFYANQNTRTPLVAAAIQAVSFVLLSLILSPIIGLAGIPLSAALTFTTRSHRASRHSESPLSRPVAGWEYGTARDRRRHISRSCSSSRVDVSAIIYSAYFSCRIARRRTDSNSFDMAGSPCVIKLVNLYVQARI